MNRNKGSAARRRLIAKDIPFLQRLAESVILQAMEDLLSNCSCDENLSFFQGNGFRLYANIAGMRTDEEYALLGLIMGTLSRTRLIDSHQRSSRAEGSDANPLEPGRSAESM